MNTISWIAIGVACAVALLAFATRRPRNAKDHSTVGAGALHGAPLDPIAARIRAGRKIEAIKLYRAHAGVGLKEAKEAIDALCARR